MKKFFAAGMSAVIKQPAAEHPLSDRRGDPPYLK